MQAMLGIWLAHLLARLSFKAQHLNMREILMHELHLAI
jgi:hypothetical protein